MWGKENAYEGCHVETQNAGLVEIVCTNEMQRNDLVALLSGADKDRGVCVLGDLNTGEQITEYKKKVDVIDLERLDSSLSVRNYLVFYTMVMGIYNAKTIELMEQLLEELEMKYVIQKSVNDLNKIEKIIVRCLAAHSKKIICLICKNLLEDLEQIQREKLFEFLKKYFSTKECLCLLVEGKQIGRREILDEVLVI